MLSSGAIATFEMLDKLLPDLNYDERESIEMLINAGSEWIETYLGEYIVYRTYTERHDLSYELALKHGHPHEVEEILFDPLREFGDDALPVTDYYHEPDSRVISIFTLPLSNFSKKTVQVKYTAGYKRIDAFDEPPFPSIGMIWLDDGTFYEYDGTDWQEVSSSLIMPDKFVNALAEIVSFNRDRLFQGKAGQLNMNAGNSSSIHSVSEDRIPANVKEILNGEGFLF
ncbi:MAG: hypothetical protein K9K80_02070 [Spirochaetia bacterium]|nr:hypothetical protein [Spirochaetia bacterium]